MMEESTYHRPVTVQPVGSTSGSPVRLEDFDQEPSARSYAEAEKRPYKELVQMMLDSGVPVTEEILRKASIASDEA